MGASKGWPPANPQQGVSRSNPDPLSLPELYRLGLILLVALIHGLVFIALIPPWQHYDEPNHFEAVWLAARLDRFPLPGDYDPKLSRQVFKSMLENGFYDHMAATPASPAAGEKVKIPGYSQLGEPPFYYLLASLPLRILPRAISVDKQLYAVRLVSLALYLFTVFVGWGAARVVAPPGHALRWLAPATLALLPGLADLMTAVNNDVAAVAVFSLFFWGSLRLVCRRFSWLNLLWVLAAAGLAYATKNTALIALALLPVVLLFAFLRGRWQWLAWAVLAVGAVAVLALSLSWGDAAAWYRRTSQPSPTRLAMDAAVVGSHVFALDLPQSETQESSPLAYQVIPPAVARAIYGQPVTLGAWMWADRPVQARFPLLKYSTGQAGSQPVDLTTQPQFFALQVALPPGSDRIWVYLDPVASQEASLRVYLDGLALAPGLRPLDQPPRFTSPDGATGEWGGQPFVNLLRNPSFEQPGPRLISRLDDLAAAILPDQARPSQILASLWDWPGAGYFHIIVVRQLFQTFWARFGWGHVPLIWGWAYGLLAVFTLLTVIGAVWGGWRLRRVLPWGAVAISLAALALAWALSLVRGIVYLHLPGYYYPAARHAYPAILPAVLALGFGWSEWIRRLSWLVWIYLAFFVFLCGLSIVTVARFYAWF
jgi:hypothetical protein